MRSSVISPIRCPASPKVRVCTDPLTVTYDTTVIKEAWIHMREPKIEAFTDNEYYVPDEKWFCDLWFPIVDAAASMRKTAKRAADRKYANIKGPAAQAIAAPVYNHFCIYTFLAADSMFFSRRRPHLIVHSMYCTILSPAEFKYQPPPTRLSSWTARICSCWRSGGWWSTCE